MFIGLDVGMRRESIVLKAYVDIICFNNKVKESCSFKR